MVNFSDVANRDIFKCSVKLANILDITPEYAKVSLGLLTKNYLIREKIREVYLGIKPNNLYDNFE
jgi:hypothetical protein